jgi:hypothetical protein
MIIVYFCYRWLLYKNKTTFDIFLNEFNSFSFIKYSLFIQINISLHSQTHTHRQKIVCLFVLLIIINNKEITNSSDTKQN